MKYIELTQGKRAIVDDDVFEYINQFKWFFSSWGYAKRTQYVLGSGRREQKNNVISMHGSLMGDKVGFQIDHINQDKLDNRKVNLRWVTPAQNKMNRKMCKNNKTGFKGVFFDRLRKLYKATITVNKKTINLGRYKTKEEAAIAYNQAAKLHQGEYAYLNSVITF